VSGQILVARYKSREIIFTFVVSSNGAIGLIFFKMRDLCSPCLIPVFVLVVLSVDFFFIRYSTHFLALEDLDFTSLKEMYFILNRSFVQEIYIDFC